MSDTGPAPARRLRVVAGLAALLLATGWADAGDHLVPGAFLVDEPTRRSLGFRWIVEGDDDRDARATVRYRILGETLWRQALPPLRIHGEPAGIDGWVCGNLFAGTVLNLEGGTPYEIEVVLDDPDGVQGETRQSRVVSTRAFPPDDPPGRTLHVYPTCGVEALEPCYEDILAAAGDTSAGDLVLIHEGIYFQPGQLDLRFLSDRATTAATPIVFRGVDRDQVVIDGGQTDLEDNNQILFLLSGTGHLQFTRMTVVNAGVAFSARNAEGLVIRGVRMDQVWSGVVGASDISGLDRNWYIADNEIIGANPVWYPYSDKTLPVSHTGIMVYGKGHVVEHNRVERFWDCIAHASTAGQVTNPAVDWRSPPSLNIDINNNELSECFDDGIEADHVFHNIRIFENRIANAHTALSAQPVFGGPAYFYRNVADNIAANSFKFHTQPVGLEAYNNTLLIHDFAFESDAGWLNARLFNNVLMAAPWTDGLSVATGTPPHPGTAIDHNAYTGSSGTATMIRWDRAFFGQARDRRSYRDLPAFFAGEGYEEHGLTVDYSIFENATHPPGEGATFEPGQQDLYPRPGAELVDTGAEVAGVTDGYLGTAPDRGAYELGLAIPLYGPRPDYLDPGGGEVACDDADDDGDGRVDEGCDDDGDGFCDQELTTVGVPTICPNGGGDCDDQTAAVHPGAEERCDGQDSDCDPATPDGEGAPWLGTACDGTDSDLCPEGTWLCVGGLQSCDDATGDSLEVCDNGEDDDCDEDVDLMDADCRVTCADDDRDGWAVCDGVCTPATGDDCGDCDDGDPEIHPGREIACGNAIDDDCDGMTDRADPDCSLPPCPDADGDGWALCGAQCQEEAGASCGDCDDADPARHPGAPDRCDGEDNDCDPASPDGVDENWLGQGCDGADADSCQEGQMACVDGTPACSDQTDDDRETPLYGTCDDGLDNDCDRLSDGADPDCLVSLQPPEGAVVRPCDGAPAFSWNADIEARYRLTFSGSAALLRVGKRSGRKWITGSSWTPSPGQWSRLLKLGATTSRLYWEVDARTVDDRQRLGVSHLRIADPETASPTLPAAGATIPAVAPPTFRWTPGLCNMTFRLEFSADPGFTAPVRRAPRQGLEAAHWTPGRKQWKRILGRVGSETVYWRVVARDSLKRETRGPVSGFRVLP